MDSAYANTGELLRTDSGGIATLTLNRPQQFNALSISLLDALQRELDRIAGDDSVRVVVLAGNGKAFCAGHDLKEIRAHGGSAFAEDVFGRCSDHAQSHAHAAADDCARARLRICSRLPARCAE